MTQPIALLVAHMTVDCMIAIALLLKRGIPIHRVLFQEGVGMFPWWSTHRKLVKKLTKVISAIDTRTTMPTFDWCDINETADKMHDYLSSLPPPDNGVHHLAFFEYDWFELLRFAQTWPDLAKTISVSTPIYKKHSVERYLTQSDKSRVLALLTNGFYSLRVFDVHTVLPDATRNTLIMVHSDNMPRFTQWLTQSPQAVSLYRMIHKRNMAFFKHSFKALCHSPLYDKRLYALLDLSTKWSFSAQSIYGNLAHRRQALVAIFQGIPQDHRNARWHADSMMQFIAHPDEFAFHFAAITTAMLTPEYASCFVPARLSLKKSGVIRLKAQDETSPVLYFVTPPSAHDSNSLLSDFDAHFTALFQE